MTDLDERRRAEFPQYERPAYFGAMRPWRVALLAEWMAPLAKARVKSYLDVGCGPAESLLIAEAFKIPIRRGCDVVESVCKHDVDLIPGVHDLSMYEDNQFDICSCHDVLEHILEEDVPSALRELDRVTKTCVLLGISRKPGPFHICIQTEEWWLTKISQNMRGKAQVIFADRIPKVKMPYVYVSVTC